MAIDSNLVTSIQLTADEALHGCKKEVFTDGMIAPLLVTFPSGMTSGRAITVEKVPCIGHGGTVTEKTLYIAVWSPEVKRKRKRNYLPLLAFIVTAACLVCGIRYLKENDPFDYRFYQGPELNPADIIPYYQQRYYLNSLDDDLQQVASILYTSVSDFKSQCTLPQGISVDEFEDLLLLMRVECPEIMQLDFSNSVRYYYDIDSSEVYSAYFQYELDQEQYEERFAMCKEKIDMLIAATDGMSDADKEKYIFDYLSLNTYYDDEAENAWNAYGAFIDRKAKCDGISLAMKWCLEEAGMSCLCFFAEPREGQIGHAWNMVKIGEKYYNVDLTASMRYKENDNQIIRDVIVYPIYNASDKWNDSEFIVCSAFDRWTERPVCETDLNSYYGKNNRLYPADTDISTILYENFENSLYSGEAISFQLLSEGSYLEMQERMEEIAKSWMYTNEDGSSLYIEWAFFACNVVWVRVTQR